MLYDDSEERKKEKKKKKKKKRKKKTVFYLSLYIWLAPILFGQRVSISNDNFLRARSSRDARGKDAQEGLARNARMRSDSN